MDFSKLNFAVDGDSITAGEQWSYHVYKLLGFASHTNVGVGSATWHKRTLDHDGHSVTTQDYNSVDFAGISDGWEETSDLNELQKRANNCAVVHIQRYLSEVAVGKAPKPDVFAFAMGTNDSAFSLGDLEHAAKGKSLKDNINIDRYTEAGAVRWCLQTILENFPLCRVFLILPIQTGRPAHNIKNLRGIDIMRGVAGDLGVQVIDCYHNCGISEKFEQEFEQGRYLMDGLHPGDAGRELMGRYIAKEIRNNLF